jgi:hypothetical protein
MPEERVMRDTDLTKREITAADLKTVKEGFQAILAEMGGRGGVFSLSQFAAILRKAKELATKVGGIDALADCAEALEELQG